MSLICDICHQHPFPVLQASREIIDGRIRTYNNIYTEDSHRFHTISNVLSTYIESLKKELEITNEVLEKARSLSSPISKVPDDLLLYIFQGLSYRRDKNRYDPAVYSVSNLRPLSLVCKRWWNIIVSTPMFWTKIYLPRLPYEQQVAFLPQLVETQLSRAGTLPLMLESLDRVPTSLMKVLEPYLSRITSLRAYLAGEDADEIFNFCSLLPNITRLDCELCSDASTSVFGLSDSFVISLPSHLVSHLSSVELKIELFVLELTLPWGQLTTLKLHLPGGVNVRPFPMFASLKRIEHLDFDLGFGSMCTSIHDWSQITFPHLRTLSLFSRYWPLEDVSFQLLQHSNLPAIQELKFTLVGGPGELLEPLNGPGLRSIVRLNLQLWEWTIHNSDTNLLLTVLPYLRELNQLESFQCYVGGQSHSAEPILQALSQESVEVLPCLKLLDITQGVYKEEAWGVLQYLSLLLETRVSPIDVMVGARKALRGVVIFFSDNVHDHQLVNKVCRPSRYNDGVTSVEVKGQFRDDFLEDELNLMGLL